MYFYTQRPDAAAFDHSLWVAVRAAAVHTDRFLSPPGGAHTAAAMAVSLRIYVVVMAAAGITLFFTTIRKLPVLNIILALTICAVLLPPLSLEYTLVHLVLPFALLCAYAIDMGQGDGEVKGLSACFACFAVIFNVETILSNRLTYAAEARTVALIVLLALVVRHRFSWTLLERTETA
jgi:hypothetical protein